MNDEPKPEPKPRKSRALSVRKPQSVKLTPVPANSLVESAHHVVHHVAEAVKAGKRVYDLARPVLDAMRRKR